MKTAYRTFKRKSRPHFYLENCATREQRCLFTRDRSEAQRMLNAENEARQSPALNLELGKVYISHADPKMGTRTWEEAMSELRSHGKPVSQARCARALQGCLLTVALLAVIVAPVLAAELHLSD